MMKRKKPSPQNLYWKFDISTFRLLGRELITDRITALFELVKNCYDANATKVNVIFENVQDRNIGKILIRDDGEGMSIDDIKNKWMVVGTNKKKRKKISDPPFSRTII